jgi:transglutaminase-like putative cysteine protease
MRAVFFCIKLLVVLTFLITSPAAAKGILCLYDSTDIKINKDFKADIKVFKEYEITSEDGIGYAEFAVPVNDYIELKDVKGYTTLPDGRKVKLGWSDIRLISVSHTLEFGGVKAYLITPKSLTVGAKIYYEYRLKINSLLYLPKITRQNSHMTKRMVVRVRPEGQIQLRYNYAGFKTKETDKSDLFYIERLPEIPIEPFSCPDSLYLYLSADTFRYNDIGYKSETWQDVGEFFKQLSFQPYRSSMETSQLADKILEGAVTENDSIENIFNFVSDSVSYIAIEVGTGDFEPHFCSDIINRRFGDCKDQSILLSELFMSAGFEAYPALVSTQNYPDVQTLRPWPSFFDHAVVSVRTLEGEIILDPSDPSSSIYEPSKRLRGKMILKTDGLSDLGVIPSGPRPSVGITWTFDTSRTISDDVVTNFSVEYLNDAALIINETDSRDPDFIIIDEFSEYLSEAGWDLRRINVESILDSEQSIKVEGDFESRQTSNNNQQILGGSLLHSYLLDNIFQQVRLTDYCGGNSIHLEELVRIDLIDSDSSPSNDYRDFWVREGIEYFDELTTVNDQLVYRKIFDYSGKRVMKDDFNELRNVLLSLRSQKYIIGDGKK